MSMAFCRNFSLAPKTCRRKALSFQKQALTLPVSSNKELSSKYQSAYQQTNFPVKFQWRSSGRNVSTINNTNRTHRFQQNRWKCTAIVRNPEVKQMCIPKEYIINSEFLKKYKCFKAFSKFFFKLFCYLAEGSQRHFKLDLLINPSHTC